MDIGNRFGPLRERAANIRQKLQLRRREPWNWLIQTASLCLLPLGLVAHSPAFIVLALLGMAAGCLALPLPPMEHTEFRRLLPLLERLIGLECAWLAQPLTRGRKWRLALWVLGAPLAAWLLWQQDLGPIGLALAVLYLLHIRRKNIEDGIEP